MPPRASLPNREEKPASGIGFFKNMPSDAVSEIASYTTDRDIAAMKAVAKDLHGSVKINFRKKYAVKAWNVLMTPSRQIHNKITETYTPDFTACYDRLSVEQRARAGRRHTEEQRAERRRRLIFSNEVTPESEECNRNCCHCLAGMICSIPNAVIAALGSACCFFVGATKDICTASPTDAEQHVEFKRPAR